MYEGQEDITEEEVRREMIQLQNGKAGNVDGMVRSGDDAAVE